MKDFWVEFKVSNSYQSTACEYRLYPYKKFHKQFLEELWTSAYCVILDNNPITLIGPYNVNYLQQQEKENIEFVVIAYGLEVLNKLHKTRVQNKPRTLIESIITDHQSLLYEALLSDCPFRTSKILL